MALCFNAHSVVCYLAYQATADLHMEIKPLLLGFIIPLFFSPASNPLNCNLSDNHLQYVYNPPASNPLNRVSDLILQFVGLSLAICLQPTCQQPFEQSFRLYIAICRTISCNMSTTPPEPCLDLYTIPMYVIHTYNYFFLSNSNF